MDAFGLRNMYVRACMQWTLPPLQSKLKIMALGEDYSAVLDGHRQVQILNVLQTSCTFQGIVFRNGAAEGSAGGACLPFCLCVCLLLYACAHVYACVLVCSCAFPYVCLYVDGSTRSAFGQAKCVTNM